MVWLEEREDEDEERAEKYVLHCSPLQQVLAGRGEEKRIETPQRPTDRVVVEFFLFLLSRSLLFSLEKEEEGPPPGDGSGSVGVDGRL